MRLLGCPVACASLLGRNRGIGHELDVRVHELVRRRITIAPSIFASSYKSWDVAADRVACRRRRGMRGRWASMTISAPSSARMMSSIPERRVVPGATCLSAERRVLSFRGSARIEPAVIAVRSVPAAVRRILPWDSTFRHQGLPGAKLRALGGGARSGWLTGRRRPVRPISPKHARPCFTGAARAAEAMASATPRSAPGSSTERRRRRSRRCPPGRARRRRGGRGPPRSWRGAWGRHRCRLSAAWPDRSATRAPAPPGGAVASPLDGADDRGARLLLVGAPEQLRGSSTASRPAEVISNTPSSFVEPKRFLTARRTRCDQRSPSKKDGVDQVLEDAGAGHGTLLVTWPTRNVAIPCSLATRREAAGGPAHLGYRTRRRAQPGA